MPDPSASSTSSASRFASPAPSCPVRVILVDDDPLTRAAIKPFLRPSQDYVVVAEAGDGHEAIDVVYSRSHLSHSAIASFNVTPPSIGPDASCCDVVRELLFQLILVNGFAFECFCFFFFNDTETTEIYTLSLHDEMGTVL